jgi:hypothetical protein
MLSSIDHMIITHHSRITDKKQTVVALDISGHAIRFTSHLHNKQVLLVILPKDTPALPYTCTRSSVPQAVSPRRAHGPNGVQVSGRCERSEEYPIRYSEFSLITNVRSHRLEAWDASFRRASNKRPSPKSDRFCNKTTYPNIQSPNSPFA